MADPGSLYIRNFLGETLSLRVSGCYCCDYPNKGDELASLPPWEQPGFGWDNSGNKYVAADKIVEVGYLCTEGHGCEDQGSFEIELTRSAGTITLEFGINADKGIWLRSEPPVPYSLSGNSDGTVNLDLGTRPPSPFGLTPEEEFLRKIGG